MGSIQSQLRRVSYWLAGSLTCLLLLTSCAPPRSSRIVVGAKNFTEQVVLGELVALEIEAVYAARRPAQPESSPAFLSRRQLHLPAGPRQRPHRRLCRIHRHGPNRNPQTASAAAWRTRPCARIRNRAQPLRLAISCPRRAVAWIRGHLRHGDPRRRRAPPQSPHYF